MSTTKCITIRGRVQGVGFRPYVFQCAKDLGIVGNVQNNKDGVRIIAQASERLMDVFINQLHEKKPHAARIDFFEVKDVSNQHNFFDFTIEPSEAQGDSNLIVPIETAICQVCLEELNDPTNHRYQYPFINCTQCGPRYTIIDSLPYDRPRTSMQQFKMCEKCEAEYKDTMNRRHHAQPISCHKCGPNLRLIKMDGTIRAEKEAAITEVRRLIDQGKVVAIKGLGGYHLVCDATNPTVVNELRVRKHRPSRPLACMVRSLKVAKQLCIVSEDDEQLLSSSEAPIVILPLRESTSIMEVAPNYRSLGIMLPYTPLHYLIFNGMQTDVLVMTSANISGLPMISTEEDALSKLQEVSDAILSDDRPILQSIDDSVMCTDVSYPTFLRRGRGYAPEPISVHVDVDGILALGSDQKNTYAIGRNKQIFLSKHIGEITGVDMVDYLQEDYERTQQLFSVQHRIAVIDKHPNYHIREWADNLQVPIFEVQHHHAHHVACMTENNLTEPCLGIILDGTGYGDDGNIWGFEVLYGNACGVERLAHLRYSPLPGGEKAIKEPWRNAVAMLIHQLEDGKDIANQIFSNKKFEIDIIEKMINKKLNSPLVGTCGRLFDAISSILGICHITSYEGEAAILLSEQLKAIHIKNDNAKPFTYELCRINELIEIDFSQMLREIVEDYLSGVSIDEIIVRFHETVVSAIITAVLEVVKVNQIYTNKVVLSGGSFHNVKLSHDIQRMLTVHKFDVYKHHRVPCGDGGLAIGQLMIAKAAL
ncbi:carbamoyltransferase HypF [Bacillus solimangrovi]|uniref:Carbamoyltransferase n=1 Tax=Bacillus solimangrovi TaxID=1305675 RepID=A0A1E5LFG9_9BACI|nr:carbamoyltransferase HypF [Bacillus solimangrovi]OEH92810.1 carbamoyltransferase HypF [Bacillus solimangrovi]